MQQRRQTPCRSSTAVWLRAKLDPGAPVDKREPSRTNRLLLDIMVTVLLAPVVTAAAIGLLSILANLQ